MFFIISKRVEETAEMTISIRDNLSRKYPAGRLGLNLVFLSVILMVRSLYRIAVVMICKLNGALALGYYTNTWGFYSGIFAIALGAWGILAAAFRNRFMLMAVRYTREMI
jgi:hypothetical protein